MNDTITGWRRLVLQFLCFPAAVWLAVLHLTSGYGFLILVRRRGEPWPNPEPPR